MLKSDSYGGLVALFLLVNVNDLDKSGRHLKITLNGGAAILGINKTSQ
jgi:hypothetical protein